MKHIYNLIILMLLFSFVGCSDLDDSTNLDQGYDWKALLMSAEKGDSDLVKKLLAVGYNPDARDSAGNTALIYAAMNGNIEMVHVLLDGGADPEIDDTYGSTPLIVAVSGGHVAIVRLLLERNAELEPTGYRGSHPLIPAAQGGYVEIVRMLLERQVDVEVKGGMGKTPLILAAEYGHTDIVRMLLEKQVNLEAEDVFGWTALMYARTNGHRDVVNFLSVNGSRKGRKPKSPLSAGWVQNIKVWTETDIDGNSKKDYIVEESKKYSPLRPTPYPLLHRRLAIYLDGVPSGEDHAWTTHWERAEEFVFKPGRILSPVSGLSIVRVGGCFVFECMTYILIADRGKVREEIFHETEPERGEIVWPPPGNGPITISAGLPYLRYREKNIQERQGFSCNEPEIPGVRFVFVPEERGFLVDDFVCLEMQQDTSR